MSADGHSDSTTRSRASGEADDSWPAAVGAEDPDSPNAVGLLRAELAAMRHRLNSVFDTAADLVRAGRVSETLERIAARAAREVGGARHLLAVRAQSGEAPELHGHGFRPEQIETFLRCLRAGELPNAEPSWLTVAISSEEHEYGFLVIEAATGACRRPDDRELLKVYARYAAIALDGAAARLRAEDRFDQTTALLEFAREVSAAGTSAEVAQRLADAVGLVVDCDEVGVHLWDGQRFTLLGYRDYRGRRDPLPVLPLEWVPDPEEAASRFVRDPRLAPMFLARGSDWRADRSDLVEHGLQAAIAVPLAATDRLLGLMFIAAQDRPERLHPTPELTAQIQGMVAQATTMLENGRLMDVVLHQARHDQLTGLSNRVQFNDDLRDAIARARSENALAGLFYLDLDRFKPVNDRFGHDTGDQLLVAIAARLSAHTPKETHLARLGGDEFAILVNAHSTAELELLDRRIRDVFDTPFEISGHSLSLTVSLGRSVLPTDAPDAASLVRIADAAMYLDKGRRNQRLVDHHN